MYDGICLTKIEEKGRTVVFMIRKLFIGVAICLTLCQCNTLKSDCQAINSREAEIAKEKPGDYYIGRRYYVPSTRFWGYLRKPQQSWRTALLVIMDESVCRNPDRGYEPPVKGAVFGTDQNVEYIVHGRYTDEKAYEPSTNLILPVFKATGFEVLNKQPGFLFKPSETYEDDIVTLMPSIMPTTQQCERFY